MNKLTILGVLITVIGLSIACNGNGQMLRSYDPDYSNNSVEELPANVSPYKTGTTSYTMDDGKMLIREANDLDFYYRLATGRTHQYTEPMLEQYDVLLVTHTYSANIYEFKIDEVTFIGDSLNVYYYHGSEDSGEKFIDEQFYYFYYVDKTIEGPRFVEIVK